MIEKLAKIDAGLEEQEARLQASSRISEIRCAMTKPVFDEGWKLKAVSVGLLKDRD